MESRPGVHPGTFKRTANRVGSTEFVAPDLVAGTLEQGFDLCRSLDAGFQRAVFLTFLVSEVHPFTDGNGRIARIMMNAELAAAGEERIVVPTVYHANYLSALRALSLTARPEPLIRVLDFAQRWTADIDWCSVPETAHELDACNAFLDPAIAEDEGRRLRMPEPWQGHHGVASPAGRTLGASDRHVPAVQLRGNGADHPHFAGDPGSPWRNRGCSGPGHGWGAVIRPWAPERRSDSPVRRLPLNRHE